MQRQVQIEARVVEVELNDAKATGVDWTVLAAQLSGAPTADVRAAAPRARRMTGLRVTDVPRFSSAARRAGQGDDGREPAAADAEQRAGASCAADALTLQRHAADCRRRRRHAEPQRRCVKAPRSLEADMLARVADGETIVIVRLHARSRNHARRKNAGVSGGWFGRARS